MKCAVLSASTNTEAILRQAGLAPLIDVIVDGNVIRRRDLEAKPAPDTILTACDLVGVAPAQAAIFETTVEGLDAGRTAGIADAVAVDSAGRAETLRPHGARVAVTDLAELLTR